VKTRKEMNQALKTKKPLFYGYIIVAVIFVIQVLMFGSNATVGVFFKPMINEFGWSRALISGAFSFARIVSGLSGIVWGWFNDRTGPRVVITICGALVGAGLLLMYLTESVWQLYLFYVVICGIGMGGVYAPQMSTIARWFSRRRNLMTGIVFVGGSLGALIFPPVSNWLISNNGWRVSWVIIGVVSLVVIVLIAQFLKKEPGELEKKHYGEYSSPGAVTGKGKLNVKGFSIKEAMKTRQLWIIAFMSFCNAFCLSTIMVHIVPHATDLGISNAAAANVLSVLSAGLLVGCLGVGISADKIGTKKIFVICFVPMLAVFLLLLPITDAWTMGLLVFIMALGNGGGSALTSTLCAELFGTKAHGVILGFSSLVSAVGGAIGPFIAGYIFDISNGYQWAFILCGALIVIALTISTFLKPVSKKLSDVAGSF
jgi:MFS family permease